MSAPESTPPSGSCGRSLSLPELGVEIRSGCAPGDYSDALSLRYSSLFSTPEYFDLYVHPSNYNACVLDQPAHSILFSVRGATADILNRLIDIEPASLDRVAAAIFRAHPAVRRIRTEAKFPPSELSGSYRIIKRADDMVVDLPGDADGYRASIGKTTRKHLRQYENQLRRKYPDFELRSVEREEISLELVQRVVGWTNERLRQKGDVSVYEQSPDKVRPLWRLLQRYGLGLFGSIGGEDVAGQLILVVGDDSWIHTVGFDSRYEDVHLGLLMTYFSVLKSIERGCRRTHMLFGTPIYKQRLGAVPVTASEVSLYRSAFHKMLYAHEAGQILLRDRNAIYWSARHAVMRRVRAGAGPARRVTGRDPAPDREHPAPGTPSDGSKAPRP